MSTNSTSAERRPAALPYRYLTVWAILAALALTYLAVLVVKPDLAERLVPGPKFGAPEDNRGQRALAKALAELKEVRQILANFERDLGELQKSVTAADTRDVALAGRVAALEAQLKAFGKGEPVRVGAPADPGDVPVAAAPAPRVLGFVEERPTKSLRDARPAEPPKVAAATATAPPTVAPPPKPSGPPVAIEVASGPSLDAVRLSWQLLQDSHKATVRNLEPRVVETAGDPPSYRLLAGPIANDAEAERLCSRLRQRRIGCSVQAFTGKPL
ncbi:MAG: SPOR domain-containing protein [Hyphomicrobiaceae bacterium]